MKALILKVARAEDSAVVVVPRGEMVAEHRRLVAVLRSPPHEDDEVEADEQEEELREYEQADGKVRKALLLKASRRRPTPAMLLAGNYRKKKMNWRGLDISIETEKGAQRSGVDLGGQPWSVTMQHDYGYIRRTKAADDEQLDCYIGPNRDATHVYVVHQHKVGDWDQYDEDKCMLDFESKRDAIAAYLAHYNDARFLGGITSMPVDEFLKLARGTAKLPRAKRRLQSDSSLSSHIGI